MKNSFKIFSFLSVAFLLVGCPNDDGTTVTPPKPYDEQYLVDIAKIDEFLDTHYVTVDADYNTTFTEIETGGTQDPIRLHPNLESIIVNKDDLEYKVYYLKFQEGTATELSPTAVDSAFVTYKGTTFYKDEAEDDAGVTYEFTEQIDFDSADNPVWFNLDGVVPGWGEIIPLFKPGNVSVDPITGLVSYANYGAGVMFLPSALGYYNSSVGSIPAYSPLIFNFKLIRQRSRDQDLDKILSRDEYTVDSDGNVQDSDGDEIPDYLDVDDDNDGILTKEEIKISAGLYYDFANIPLCSGTGANGKKKHLDPSCQ